MTALRVAVVHTDPLPGEKAGSLTVARSAAGLADNDTGVVLIMRDGGDTLEQALRAIELEPPEGLSVLRLASYGPFSVRHTGWFARGVTRALLRLPEAEAPDVILVRNLKLAVHLLRLRDGFSLRRRLPGVPIAYEAHNWYGDLERKWADRMDLVPGDKLRSEERLSRLERRLLPRIDGLVALTQPMLELMAGDLRPGVSSAVAPMSTETPEHLAPVSREPVLVYVGQLHCHKGIDVAIRALLELPTSVRLQVVGGPERVGELRALAQSLGLASRVELLGLQPHPVVVRELRRARIGLLPLLDCFYNRYLTSPVKLFEYGAAGLCVVGSRLPAVEACGRDEQELLLVEPGDPAALAAAVRRILDEPELESRLRTSLWRRCRAWGWNQRGEVLRSLCEAAVESYRTRVRSSSTTACTSSRR